MLIDQTFEKILISPFKKRLAFLIFETQLLEKTEDTHKKHAKMLVYPEVIQRLRIESAPKHEKNMRPKQ